MQAVCIRVHAFFEYSFVVKRVASYHFLCCDGFGIHRNWGADFRIRKPVRALHMLSAAQV